MQTEVLDEFLFADDMAKRAPTEEKMQKCVDQVSDSCDTYDVTISIKKTEGARRGSTIGFHLFWHAVELAVSARLCL